MRGSDRQEYGRGRDRSAGLDHRYAVVLPLVAVAAVAVSALPVAAWLPVSADPGAPDSTARIASAARSAVGQTAFAEFLAFPLASVLAVEVFPFLVPAADTRCPRV